jgi:hypothetical protein
MSVPASAYVYVTVGSVLPIETIRWVYGTGDIGDALTIQVSNDKITWSPIHAAGNAPVGEWQMATFSGLSAKYVRWWYDNPNSDPVIGGLAEVEIYGPGAYNGSDAGTATPIPTSSASPAETPAAGTPDLPGAPETTATATPVAPGDASPVAIETQAGITEPTASVSTTPMVIPETPVETVTPSPPADVTPTPYPVAQTSRSASSLPGALAVDGKPETVWRSAPEGNPGRVVVLTLDLGEEREVGAVRILPGGDGLRGRATIESSHDGVTWTYYAEPAAVDAGDDGWLLITAGDGAPIPVTARFVRVVFAGEGSEPLGGIAEIQIVPPNP